MLLFLFGMAIGFASGLLGIGGGVLLVPGLILLFGFSQSEAQGTSLAVLIPPIGILAALVYYQHGFVRLPVVALIAVGFLLGAYLGAKAVPQVSPAYMRLGLGTLLLYLGFSFVLNPTERQSNTALPAGLAALLFAIVAWFRRRRGQAEKVVIPRSGSNLEYHI